MPVEVQRKLTVLGFPGVGKSSLTTCFVENRFVENYDPTIENTFHKTIRFRNAHFVTDIVDTAGMVRLCCMSVTQQRLLARLSRSNLVLTAHSHYCCDFC